MSTTIAAIATTTGGALCIIRISGPESKQILQNIFSGRIENRMLNYGEIRFKCELIDQVTAVYFQGPGSFTGEDMVEIITHGGQAVVSRVYAAVLASGARPAEAGEFSRRAFVNGKMDLTKAEAIMDLISAQSERSAKSAALQLSGSVAKQINSILNDLIDALASVNACIDYPDELEEDVIFALPETLHNAHQRIRGLIKNGFESKVLREGARVVLMGLPNAGKSALYNALLGIDRAIVTEISGTTRDILMESVQFKGIPIVLVDTAGLHDTLDPVEALGVQKAKEIQHQADLLLLVFDATIPLSKENYQLLNDTAGKKRLMVFTKADLIDGASFRPAIPGNEPYHLVSSVTGQGIDHLKENIADTILPADQPALITNIRHIEALKEAGGYLESALASQEPDCIATDISSACDALCAITGRSASVEVIDRIFQRFCVGK